MDFDEENNLSEIFILICPNCGVGNPENSDYCIFCDKDLKETILFLEDDSFDLEITEEFLVEYRKKFWGKERTGKVNKYKLSEIENIHIGSPVSRFIFKYKGKRIVFPLKEENLEKIKKYFHI